jgi:hypothetical protein
MVKKSLLIFCVLCAAILIGCNKTETVNSNATTTNSNSNATKSTTTTTTSTPATTTTSAGDKIGVPECDDFIAKYEACVSNKVPEIARAQFQGAVKQWKDSWKKLAENPQTKGTLAAACKQAKEQQEAALKTYGCSF